MSEFRPTEKQTKAEVVFDIVLNEMETDVLYTDQEFSNKVDEIAAELGLTWKWRWDDELVVVWIDDGKAAYFVDVWKEFVA